MPNIKSLPSTRIRRIIENSQALILAGGLGTRLRPAFNGGPKSLAPIGDHFFLEYLLIWLRSAGIKELILCVGYEKDQIQNWLVDGAAWELRVTYSVEETLLGTAGALVARMLGSWLGWYGTDEAGSFISSVLGAILVLLLYGTVFRRKHT